MARVHQQVKIINQLGLHARPASELVKEASRFKSDVFLARDGYRVNGKSIMGVMMLAAEHGAVLEIMAEGVDAEAAVDSLQRLVESGFGEA